MLTTITVVKYTGIKIIFGFFSMIVFRILLFFDNGGPKFRKLMGTGKNGTFDIKPDLGQWVYFFTWDKESEFEDYRNKSKIFRYINYFSKTEFSIILSPIQSHGLWDKQEPFKITSTEKPINNIAVLTRATINLWKANDFWKNVPKVAENLSQTPGLIYSIGFGEIPFLKQATLSIWKDVESMKSFAYKGAHHKDVITKTKSDNWYSEELFARFMIVRTFGSLPEKIILSSPI
ncbi:DUF3291 domain-containing protein [Lacihabitans sp. LS3-19]|uniref:DUF3291 domain-containing protein n=1 Tax=Lacihabitans sp. LS3-19 TaxID=2487335 RepID=UPI0020CC8321|nr:DUF3291 domain-containing protein [Lacihabitans sp. LS3-19]MCP9767484.1 DUF3291 domain-containing protein [Lacihabitans sp. LS3-19]